MQVLLHCGKANATLWRHEANCTMRMPGTPPIRPPGVVPFDALVIDTFDGVSEVVGLTTHYVPGETLAEIKDRVCELN